VLLKLSRSEELNMQAITTFSFEIAKSVFQVHGMSQIVHYSGIGQSPIRGTPMINIDGV
jgi:hypothetical protein